MSKSNLQKILDHPDKEEIISKLALSISISDIHEWLKTKYSNINENKFVISESALKNFKGNYLDIYNTIQKDILKTKTSITNPAEELELALRNNSAYKSALIGMATKELDIKQMIANLCKNVETRLAQVFDAVQEDPSKIDSRVDRLLIEYAKTLGDILEKYYRVIETPTNPVVQHNVTLQVVDQHASIFHDVIKDVLSQMDLETSLYFMEIFNDRMGKIRQPIQQSQNVESTDVRHAEAKLLNENINKRLNE